MMTCVFHMVVSVQEGAIQLIDVGACSVVHTEQAHSGAVWSLALLPDKSGFVTGSAGEKIQHQGARASLLDLSTVLCPTVSLSCTNLC
jgi:hypothetical protein